MLEIKDSKLISVCVAKDREITAVLSEEEIELLDYQIPIVLHRVWMLS